VGSAILRNRHFHGQYEQWLVKDSKDKAVFPYYTSSAASLLFAFHMVNSDKKASSAAAAAHPTFLNSIHLNMTSATAEVLANPATPADKSKAGVQPAGESVKVAVQKGDQEKVETQLPIQSPKDSVQAVQLDQAKHTADVPKEETKPAVLSAKDAVQMDLVKPNDGNTQKSLSSMQQKSKEQLV